MIKDVRGFIASISLTQLCWLAILLCIPAFFINLGRIGFIGDEAIRTLVAFEMKLSGNFIVPTINGEEYFNKPPLYNWFIYLTSEIFGSYGEWPSRITTLVFLGLFGISVYYFSRKQFDRLTAITLALMVVTSGRILFWDGMLGLIDICFSWIVYLNFMILYFLGRAERWRLMFILSYLLFSVAFLLKGFPAVVFQGISMLVALQLHGVLKKKLFNKSHWVGIGLGVIPVLAYYGLYSAQVDLQRVFSILMEQSMQRTATHHSIIDTLTHILTFPFEEFYHFLPWSLLVIVSFYPKFLKIIRSNDFIRFNFWMLLANLPVYWVSVEVYPRYLLMFIPLFNIVGYYVLHESRKESDIWWNIVRYTFISLTVIGFCAALVMPLIGEVQGLPYILFVSILGAFFLGVTVLGMLWDKARTFLWFAITLLVVRSIFNMVVLPIRAIDHGETRLRNECLRAAELYNDQNWYIFDTSEVNIITKAYTSIQTNQLIRRVDEATDPKGIYLVRLSMYPDFPGIMIDSIEEFGGSKQGVMRIQE